MKRSHQLWPAHGEANQRLRLVSTGSSTDLLLPDNSVDFIFTDPPFGDNLMYSELNFLVEAWLRVYTNDSPRGSYIENTS